MESKDSPEIPDRGEDVRHTRPPFGGGGGWDGGGGDFEDLINRFKDRATAYRMKVSTENSKITKNNTHNISADISMNVLKLKEVTSSKCLGVTLCKDGTCSAEVRTRTASETAAMARLNRIWRCNTITQLRKQVQALEVSYHLHHPLCSQLMMSHLAHVP